MPQIANMFRNLGTRARILLTFKPVYVPNW